MDAANEISPIHTSNNATIANEDDESDGDDDRNVAKNLLGIRRSVMTNWEASSGARSEANHCQDDEEARQVSVTKFFQPKFVEIYDAFLSYAATKQVTVDISKHTMIICLEYLISFSCWARQSNARSAWIRATLEENSDLRPEVRNGLSMILIYSISAAKASLHHDSDMFTVLQDQESGLGIVNKTSLKIYNDPFNFFTFLKSCVSGLIDAGILPENERQNQPKKSKKQVENKEEISAFMSLKGALVVMLETGDNALCRTKIQHILAVWQHKTKKIRSNRFAMAVKVLTNQIPIPSDMSGYLDTPILREALKSSRSGPGANLSSMLTPLLSSSSSSSSIAMANQPEQSLSHPSEPHSRSSHPDMSGEGTFSPASISADLALSMNGQGQLKASSSFESLDQGRVRGEQGGGDVHVRGSDDSSFQGGSAVSDGQVEPSYGSRGGSSDGSSSASSNHQRLPFPSSAATADALAPNKRPPARLESAPQRLQKHPRLVEGKEQGGEHVAYFDEDDDDEGYRRPMAAASLVKHAVAVGLGRPNSLPAHGPGSHGVNTGLFLAGREILPLQCGPIRTLCFERVGLREWEFKEFRIYDLNNFIKRSTVQIYFINEGKLAADEMRVNSMVARSSGFVSLQVELQNRGALVSSWPRNDFSQLQAMVRTWASTCPNATLLEFWEGSERHSMFSTERNTCEAEQEMAVTAAGDNSRGDTSNCAEKPKEVRRGEGLLAYEVVLQVGLIVRGCESLGFSEDCWRFLYPKELHTEALMMSFGAFLASIFPQTRAIIATGVDLSSVIVKYHPHKVDAAVVQVPKRMGGESYQTIGTLDEMASTVISRLEATLSFYDFILCLS